jgi:hypothetical protein
MIVRGTPILHYCPTISQSARCLYAGVPCGAVVGSFVAQLAGISGSPSAIGVQAHLHLIQSGTGIVALILPYRSRDVGFTDFDE